MIFWSGRGGFVALIVFVMVFLAEFGSENYFQDKTYYQTHAWPMAVAFFCAALLTFFLARYLGQNLGRTVIDKATGQEIILKPSHRLFFVDIKYWPIILACIGVAVFIFKK